MSVKELDTQRDGDLHARRRCVPASSGNSRCSIVDGVEDARRGQLHPPRARPWREAGLRIAHHLAVSPKSTRRSLVPEHADGRGARPEAFAGAGAGGGGARLAR